MGPKASLDVAENKNYIPLPGIEPLCPILSTLFYRLSSPGFYILLRESQNILFCMSSKLFLVPVSDRPTLRP
jgi:hypothetical protein